MPAPTLVAAYVSPINPSAGPSSLTSPSLSLQAGDVVTIIGMGTGGSPGDKFNAPTTTFANGGITQLQAHTGASDCQAGAWTFTVSTTGSGTVTVSVTTNGNNAFNFVVLAHRGAVAPTAARSALGTGSSRTLAYTASQADSAIAWVLGDWNASAIQSPTPTPTTHSTSSPGPSALPQSGTLSGQYTENVAVLDDQTSTGSVSYGVGGSGTGPFTLVVVEIQGAAGGTTNKSSSDTSSASDSVSLLARASTAADTASSTDVSLSMVVSLSASEFAFSGDALGALDATLAASETSGGTDLPAAKGSSASDAGGASEAVTSKASTATDSGSSSEAGGVDSSEQRTGIETGAATDAVLQLAVQITAADVSTATDAIALLARTVTELASGTDLAAGVFTGNDLLSGDSSTSSETAVLAVSGQSPESGGATEAAFIEAAVTSADAASSAEHAVLEAALGHTEGATSTETASLTVLLSATEVVSAVEAVAQIVGPPAVRDWSELSATVVLSGEREAIFKITRLEG